MRTVGVEEELFLVDGESGRPRAVAGRVVARAADRTEDGPGGTLAHELQQQQVETDTAPHESMAELGADLERWRDTAITEAREAGARVIASGTSPMPVEPQMVRSPRFDQLAEHYGLTAHEQLACACHVHVAVESDDEGVGVLDRIRPWLPALVAMSANSPFARGADTGYASFRSQMMMRWPSAGPYDPFGSAEAYHALVDQMVATGVPLDPAMVYFDARLSRDYPTVEIRVSDVCLDVRDTVLVAAVCRAMVDTAAREWAAGEPVPGAPTAMLRLAAWQAGRHGVGGDLLDPASGRPRPAADVLNALVDHVRPALRDNGDEALVETQLDRVLTRGTGAMRQRAVHEKTGQLVDVVADLARVTAGLDD